MMDVPGPVVTSVK